MKKLQLILVSLLFIFHSCYSQEKEVQKTKIDEFSSATGEIIKYTDYEAETLSISYGVVKTKIRKFSISDNTKFFFQISKKGKYSTKKASIAYEDLLEVNKAINVLKASIISDEASNPSYFENKFVSDDGFQVGYYVSKGKASWYISLEKYGSDNSIFIKDLDNLESVLNDAIEKIKVLKKQP